MFQWIFSSRKTFGEVVPKILLNAPLCMVRWNAGKMETGMAGKSALRELGMSYRQDRTGRGGTGHIQQSIIWKTSWHSNTCDSSKWLHCEVAQLQSHLMNDNLTSKNPFSFPLSLLSYVFADGSVLGYVCPCCITFLLTGPFWDHQCRIIGPMSHRLYFRKLQW